MDLERKAKLKYWKEYNFNNKEKRKKWRIRYRLKNKEKLKAYDAEYRLRKKLGYKKKKVYIAGKYNDSNIISCLANIKLGIKAAVKAIHVGYIPFCPFLDFLFNLVADPDLTREEYQSYSMEWLYSCDEIWLLPNWKDSPGTLAEKAKAEELGLVVKYV